MRCDVLWVSVRLGRGQRAAGECENRPGAGLRVSVRVGGLRVSVRMGGLRVSVRLSWRQRAAGECEDGPGAEGCG